MAKRKGKEGCGVNVDVVGLLFLFSHHKEENIGMLWTWWSLLGQNSQARKGKGN